MEADGCVVDLLQKWKESRRFEELMCLISQLSLPWAFFGGCQCRQKPLVELVSTVFKAVFKPALKAALKAMPLQWGGVVCDPSACILSWLNLRSVITGRIKLRACQDLMRIRQDLRWIASLSSAAPWLVPLLEIFKQRKRLIAYLRSEPISIC